MGWYATRSVYHIGCKLGGVNIFEERIVCFEAYDFKEANVKALNESEKYALENNCDMHDEQLTFKQDGAALIDGYELWSELYEAKVNLSKFYEERYKKFVYDPETDWE